MHALEGPLYPPTTSLMTTSIYRHINALMVLSRSSHSKENSSKAALYRPICQISMSSSLSLSSFISPLTAVSSIFSLCISFIRPTAPNAKIVYYDPKKLDMKPTFPFRASTFVLDPTKVRTYLLSKSQLNRNILLPFLKWPLRIMQITLYSINLLQENPKNCCFVLNTAIRTILTYFYTLRLHFVRI